MTSQASRATDPLVGRDAVLSRLRALLGPGDGERHTALIVGESGVGKTRLLAEVAAIARESRMRVASGAANAVEHGLSYALVREMLTPLVGALSPDALRTTTRGHVAALAQIFPMLDARGAGIDDGADVKARAFWACGALLGRLAEREPLLLIADNLQWADTASLELLHYLARGDVGGRIHLVGAWTLDDAAPSERWALAERSAVSLGFAEILRVQPLTLDDVVALLVRGFGVAPATVREFAALLFGWTRGNPLFVHETLHSLVERGDLRERDGVWEGWDVRALVLPRSVRDTFAMRLAALDAAACSVARVLAVAGSSISHDRLAAVAALDDDPLLAALDALRRHGMLHERSEGDVLYELAHPILREVVLADAGPARVRRIHVAMAHALEAPALRGTSEEIAAHLLAAGSAADLSRHGRTLLDAGAQALARHATSEASRYLEAAFDAIPAPSEEHDHATELLARAREREGDYARAADLWDARRVRATTTGDGHAEASALLRLGRVSLRHGRYDAALEHLDAAGTISEQAGDRHLVARTLMVRAACLQELGRAEDAREALEHAADIAAALGDASLRARTARELLLLSLWRGSAREADEHGRHALALAQTLDDDSLLWSAHWALAVLAGLTGDAAAVATHTIQCERLAAQLGSPALALATAEVAVEFASATGAWDDGLARADRAIALARALGGAALLPRLLVWSALMRLGRGEHAAARAALEEAESYAGAGTASTSQRHRPHVVIPVCTGWAAYWLAQGDPTAAMRVAAEGLEVADRTGYVVWGVHRLLPIYGEAALWAGEFHLAASLTARMRRDAATLEHRLGAIWADACDALLVLLRDHDAARALPELARAADALDAIPFPEYAARVRRQVASALHDIGDVAGARRELRRAHDTLIPMRAEGVLAGIRAQLREYGARPPGIALPAEQRLTGREAQIAALVAKHRTNAQIGKQLGISTRTVSTHLTNIFTKVGVTSRAELADVVRGVTPSALTESPT